MRRQSWLILSVGLNLLLALVVAREWQRHPASGLRPRHPRAEPHAAAPATPFPTRAVAPVDVESAENFNWQQLESDDYKAFIEKLRAVGCPDLTIYDIVSDEVNDYYDGKAKEVVDSVTGDFWNLIISTEKLKNVVEEKQHELEVLRAQKRELMEDLFETNPVEKLQEDESEAACLAADKVRLDFLPEDKIAKVIEIQNRFNERLVALQRSGTTEWPKKHREIEEQRDRDLQAALTPEEYVEYRLRQNNAVYVRESLAEFDGTEEEFRAIAVARMNDQGDGPVEKLLGPERFAEYKRAQDSDYALTLRIAKRFGLSQEAAQQIYQLQQDARAQAKIISRDPYKSEAERRASLQMLRGNTEQAINGILGPTAFAVYHEHAGHVLDKIAKTDP